MTERLSKAERDKLEKLWVVMSEPPSPTSQFVELENEQGEGNGGAQWLQDERDAGLWKLGRFYLTAEVDAILDAL